MQRSLGYERSTIECIVIVVVMQYYSGYYRGVGVKETNVCLMFCVFFGVGESRIESWYYRATRIGVRVYMELVCESMEFVCEFIGMVCSAYYAHRSY